MRRGKQRHERPLAPRTTAAPIGGGFGPLSTADRDAVVEHAFDILERIGLAGAPDKFVRLLVDAGATTRHDGRVLMSRTMVHAALGRAPSTVDLPGFDPHSGLSIGRAGVHIGTGGAAVQTLDSATGTYRDSNLDDLFTMMRVLDECPNIHYGLRPLIARDVTTDLELDLNTAFASVLGTRKPTGISFTSPDHVDPVVDLLDLALGPDTDFAERPFSMAVVVHVVPPLRFAADGCEVMERAIERGMIVQLCSAGQAGATSPASLAGSLAQGLAEILAGVVLADAIKPGHPCIHAFMPFVSDLRTGSMTGGSGEAAVASAAAAQLMRHLEIPHAVSAGITESKTADIQAGYEKSYTVTLSAHAGADMVQLSVGMLGSIMVASPEILVIDDEMCGAILRSVRGVDVRSDFLDLDVIESVVTGDGHYLGHEQTLELMRSEYVYPELGDRASVAEWVDAGEPAMWDRAQRRVRDILDGGRPRHLSTTIESQIRDRFPIHLQEMS